MSLETLKWLRFITPGVVILVFAALLSWFTNLWNIPLPADLKSTTTYLSVIIAGGLYYLTPLRSWSNRKFAKEVSENIRSKLVHVAGVQDDPVVYTWRAVRVIFFNLVDRDPNLSAKARLAYFNGYIWTTLADVRVLAVIFMAYSALISILPIDGALFAAVTFIIIGSLSYLGSAVVTRRHRDIGDEQIEIIRLNCQPELHRMMELIRDGTGAGGN